MRRMLTVICARRCFDVRMCLHESSVSSLSFVRGNALMCVCVCMNEAYAHFHVSEAMVSCAYVCMNKAYGHGHLCEVLQSRAHVCA
jgi:hypothetical protein